MIPFRNSPNPSVRTSMLLTIVLVVAATITCVSAQEKAIEPENYALLIAVTSYEHAELNGRLPLQFPEKDARAIGQLLEQSGYEVEYLLGVEATREAILSKLEALRSKGNSAGVCVVGFFGHGVEAEFAIADGQTEIQGCFCPFDTEVQQVKNADGKPLFDGNQPLIEPDPASLVTMSNVVQSLAIAKAGSRLLIADCCREIPNRARGRSLGLGANFSTDRLPQQTVMLFGCKSGEKAWEQPAWGHGAFTKALLEELDYLMRQSDPVTTGTLADRVKRNVQRLTGNTQNPHPISLDSIDLQLTLAMPEVFTNSVGATMQLIPAGEFMMGSALSPDEVKDRYSDDAISFRDFLKEHPRHLVRLTRPFYLSQTEVTVGQFRRFVEATGYQTEAERDGGGYALSLEAENSFSFQDPKFNWRNPSFASSDEHPVVQISWNDAVAYCEWLSREEKRDYRLPTEAEWEYACRAGTSGEFSFGDEASELDQYAWYESNSGNQAHRVAQKRPNPWGLYDMYGNAWEWCSDRVGDYPSGMATDPIGPPEEVNRVCRGGSFDRGPKKCRSAERGGEDGSSPSARWWSSGFRLALSPSGISE